MARILLTTVWAMVALDTAMFVIDIRNTVKEVSLTLTSTADLSLEDRYALTDNLPWAVQSALYAFLVRCYPYPWGRAGADVETSRILGT